jgi:hypothetical protein
MTKFRSTRARVWLDALNRRAARDRDHLLFQRRVLGWAMAIIAVVIIAALIYGLGGPHG